MDGLVLPGVELHHHAVGVDHLHHLGRRRERRDRDYSRIAGNLGWTTSGFIFGGGERADGPGERWKAKGQVKDKWRGRDPFGDGRRVTARMGCCHEWRAAGARKEKSDP